MTTELHEKNYKMLQAINLNLNNFYEDFLTDNECPFIQSNESLLHYLEGARESLYSLETCYAVPERKDHEGLSSKEEFLQRVSKRHLTNAFEYLQDFCKVSRLKDSTDKEDKEQLIECYLEATDLMQQVLVLIKNTEGVERI